MDYIIQLEPLDDFVSIRSRVETVLTPTTLAERPSRQRVLLVVPGKNQSLHRLVNAKLLARLAEAKGIEIGLVTRQAIVRQNASQAGLNYFSSAQAAKRLRWLKRNAVIAMPKQTLPPTIERERQTIEVEADRLTQKKRQRKRYRLVEGGGRVGCIQQMLALLIAPLAAMALVLGLFVLIPEGEVTLTPVAQTVETDFVVRGDPNIEKVDFRELKFPARLAQVDLTVQGNVPTIDQEFAPTGYATGYVNLINRTDVEQDIPISTTVVASAGKNIEYMIVSTTTVPAGVNQLLSVPVRAVEPGPAGNISAGQISRFSDPRYGVVTRVINEFGIGGGTLELRNIVEDDDKLRLQEHLRELTRIEGLKQIQGDLEPQEFVAPETVRVIPLAVSFNEFAGDFSDTFSGEMQAAVRVTVVSGYDANQLALAALESQVPSNHRLNGNGLYFGAGEVLDTQDGIVSFRVIASGKTEPIIDSAEVARIIASLPIGEAQAVLTQQYDLATVPGVEIGPPWLADYFGRMPFNPIRIRVNINDAVRLQADSGE